MRLRFVKGTLECDAEEGTALPPEFLWDPRSESYRAPASAYTSFMRFAHHEKVAFDDEARKYVELPLVLKVRPEPRPYQSEALEAWTQAKKRGVVVLPTGAGKTLVAHLAIEHTKRSTLIVAPTLDLVRQWYDGLKRSFGEEVGLVGGGEHDVRPLTVTTYDSAALKMHLLGNVFGLLVFDEVHHLPSETYSLAAKHSLAPFRLGLTATPDRTDGNLTSFDALIGPIVYRREITDLAGDFLAEYRTERVRVELEPNEREAYDSARAEYVNFLRSCGVDLGKPNGWAEFLMVATRTERGRKALDAYRMQRAIAFSSTRKLAYVDHLLSLHRGERMILFTQDNDTAYRASRRFLIPIITHQTSVRERSDILRGLEEGRYGAVVTSKVLNEGVDVPSASVAIVLSGSGSVREHVQRLGRVLRKREGKQAILYELVSEGTLETSTSQRRREHLAYQ